MRNCRKVSNPNIGYTWAPSLLRCPWSQLTPEVLDVMRWWTDWRTFKSVPPWGSEPCDWPHYVYEAITICEAESAKVEAEKHEQEMRRCRTTK